jgi:hypothetical protein
MRLSRIAGVAVLVAVFTGAAAPAQAQIKLTGISHIQGISYVNGVLTVASATLSGTLNGIPFTTDITNLVLGPAQAGSGSCSVLNLELGPIHVFLLGLYVDTSPICLTITAQQGGGILGDLLCGLSSDLAGAGGVLATITGIVDKALSSGGFLSSLSDILNQALAQAHGHGNGQGPGSVCMGECTILNVVLGPLTLNLLGVTVELNNCSNGPVRVCVSATAGQGVLGDLLCGLADAGGLNVTLQDLLGIIDNLLTHLNLP